LFVRNPRRKNRSRRSNRGYRRNALAVQANRGAVQRLLKRIKSKARKNAGRRKNRSTRRNGGWSLRRNGIRRLSNGRFASSRRNSRRKNSRRRNSRRRNGPKIAFRPGRGSGAYKRAHTAHKQYGYRANRRKNSRRNSRRRNTDMTMRATGALGKLVRKVPILGPRVAPFVAPAMTGALSFVPVHFALKYGGEYLPDPIKPVAYTTAGILIALVSTKIPKLTKNFKGILGATAVAAGATIDTFRYFSGTSQELGAIEIMGDGMGDGMAYDVTPLDGLALQGGDMGAIEIMGDYSDAVMADATYSGHDLSAMEGTAALSGPMAWRGQFRAPPLMARRQQAIQSRHAGRPGHRWGWLIQLVGWDHFRKIAAMPAPQRMAFIAKLRQDAVTAVAGLTEADVQIETAGLGGLGLDMSGLGSHVYASAAY
jgi:hypothetical protein